MAELISILIVLLIIVCVGLIGWWIIGKMGLPSPASWIVQVIFGAILLIALLYAASPYLHLPH